MHTYETVGVVLETVVLVVATASVAVGSTGAATPSEPPRHSISASDRATLLSEAKARALFEGDNHPYDIQAVRTTHREAEHIACDCSGGIYAPQDAPVYLVAMRGLFDDVTWSGPPTAHFRKPTVITMEFFQLDDLRIYTTVWAHSYPNLREAGAPVRLEAGR